MSSEQPRVLVLDANPETSRVMGEFLSEKGFTVQTVMSSDRLDADLESFRPDVVVLGMELAHKSSFDLVERHLDQIRRLDASIVMVAPPMADMEHIRHGLDLGVEGYLFRPLQGAEVATRLAVLMRRRNLLFQRIQRARLEGLKEVSVGLVGRLESWLGVIDAESLVAKEGISSAASGREELHEALSRIERIREALAEIRETATLIHRMIGAVPVETGKPRRSVAEPPDEAAVRRRSGTRVHPSAMVTVHHGEHSFPCLAYEMNEGGMFLMSPLEMPPEGTRLRIELHISSPKLVPLLNAVVVRTRTAESEASDGQPLGIGIRFENLSPEAVEAIHTYLTALRTPKSGG